MTIHTSIHMSAHKCFIGEVFTRVLTRVFAEHLLGIRKRLFTQTCVLTHARNTHILAEFLNTLYPTAPYSQEYQGLFTGVFTIVLTREYSPTTS